MTRVPKRSRRVLRLMALLVAIGLSVFAVDACIISEPPGDLPQLPPVRPAIMRESVVPPASSVMGTWPGKFIVQVALVDPTVTFQYAVFFDYNELRADETLVTSGKSSFVAGNANSRERTLEIALEPPTDLDRCHKIEIVVALEIETRIGTLAHSQGDIVTWFYSPSGDLAGCPVLDAGLYPIDATDDVESGPP